MSASHVQAYLDYMVEDFQARQIPLDPINIFHWTREHKVLVGSINDRGTRWAMIRDFMMKKYSVEYPINLLSYDGISEHIKELKEKEKTNV